MFAIYRRNAAAIVQKMKFQQQQNRLNNNNSSERFNSCRTNDTTRTTLSYYVFMYAPHVPFFIEWALIRWIGWFLRGLEQNKSWSLCNEYHCLWWIYFLLRPANQLRVISFLLNGSCVVVFSFWHRKICTQRLLSDLNYIQNIVGILFKVVWQTGYCECWKWFFLVVSLSRFRSSINSSASNLEKIKIHCISKSGAFFAIQFAVRLSRSNSKTYHNTTEPNETMNDEYIYLITQSITIGMRQVYSPPWKSKKYTHSIHI